MSAEYVYVPESDRESRLLAEIERLKALITELADVLESYGFDELLDLIRRAREAAK